MSNLLLQTAKSWWLTCEKTKVTSQSYSRKYIYITQKVNKSQITARQSVNKTSQTFFLSKAYFGTKRPNFGYEELIEHDANIAKINSYKINNITKGVNTHDEDEHNEVYKRNKHIITGFLFRLLFILGLGLAILFTLYESNNSVYFYGESKKFEDDYEQSIQEAHAFSIKSLIENTTEFIWTLLIFKDIERAEMIAERVRTKFPTLFLGDLLLCYIEQAKGNITKTLKHYENAIMKSEEFLKENEPIQQLLPPRDALFVREWKPIITEVVPNTIWAINAPFYMPNSKAPMELQCSIVRLPQSGNNKTSKADLIIINPTEFNQETRNFINKLGTVKAVITPCLGHSAAIERVIENNYWPSAKYYGTDKVFKHDAPHLPLIYIDETTWKYGDHLIPIMLRGQMFSEMVFYHPSSNSLLGFADTLVRSFSPNVNNTSFNNFPWSSLKFEQPNISPFAKLYAFGLGMWRGDRSAPLSIQNYNNMFMLDKDLFRESIAEVLEKEIDFVVLGHGGIFGKEGKAYVGRAFGWIENDPVVCSTSICEYFHSPLKTFDSFYLRALYMWKCNLLLGTSKMFLSKIITSGQDGFQRVIRKYSN